MLCSSQVRYRGSPHLNCDPFSPGREGFLAGLPDTVQAATAHTALGRAEGWAGSAAPCPCPRLNLSHHSAPDSAGGGISQLLWLLSLQKCFQGAARMSTGCYFPLCLSLKYTQLHRAAARRAAPLDLVAVTFFFLKAPSVSLVAVGKLGNNRTFAWAFSSPSFVGTVEAALCVSPSQKSLCLREALHP